MEQTHIIRQLNLRLQIPAVDKAFALQQRAKQCLEGDWYRELGQVLDKYADNAGYLYVPALHLNLEMLPEEDFERHFREALLAAVDKALAELVQNQAIATAALPEEEALHMMARVSKEERYIDAWFYFIEKGMLPWWLPQETAAGLEPALLEAVRARPVLFRESWYRAWHHRTVNVPRWLLQNAPALRQVMLDALCPAPLVEQYRHWMLAVEKAFAGHAQLPLKQLQYTGWHSFFQFLDSGHQYKSDALQQMTGILTTQFPLVWMYYAKEEMQPEERAILQQATVLFTAGANSVQPVMPGMAPVSQPPGKVATQRPPVRRHFPEVPEQGIQIGNAGLILLHPFLTHLFRHLQWLQEKDRVIAEPYTNRAVHLLEFLSSGREQLPEYDMVFPKLLCGIPVETSIERDIVLEPFEKQQAESLLKAVLEHWPPLSSSGVPALRETFLQREGLLQFRNNEWLLKVEHRTVDILLNKLPWGIGVVRLPWMPYLLKADWAL